MKAIPELPPLPMLDPEPVHYARERTVNGVRYFYFRQMRCTVESWKNDAHPKWERAKRRRKTWQPNV